MMAFTTDRIVDIFLKTIYFVCYALILFFSVALFVEIVPCLLDGITENELVIHGLFLIYFMSAILLFRWGIIEMKNGQFFKHFYHFSCLILMLLLALFVFGAQIFLHAPPVGHG
jgi:hypothetical protein